jgi:hypothetical protein
MQLTRSIRQAEWNMSSIANLVCPNCGGAIAVRKDELRCQGRCGRDWRSVWEDLRSRLEGSKYGTSNRKGGSQDSRKCQTLEAATVAPPC